MGQSKAVSSGALAAPRKGSPALGDFLPLESLWSEGGAAIFRGEQSARWFIRSHRQALVDASAIAIHAGRMLVHPARFLEVAQKIALEAAIVSVSKVGDGA